MSEVDIDRKIQHLKKLCEMKDYHPIPPQKDLSKQEYYHTIMSFIEQSRKRRDGNINLFLDNYF